MSTIKRVSLTSIESNNDKIKTKRKGSFRISIPIVEEPSSKDYSRFNYETLYKSALDKKRLKKDTNGAQNGLTNGGGLEVEEDGDEDELVKIAKKFEQKYGGTQKKDNYSELGAGYDEEDSFIDNTDAYNDELSEDLLPKHGGYYLNRGNLELERIDLPEEVIENEEEICRNKIKRTINVIQSSDEEGDEGESSEAEESGRDENDEDDDDDEEDEEDEECEEPENEAESEVKNEVKTEPKPIANGLSNVVPSKTANPESILSTIESVIGNHGHSNKHGHNNDVSVIKKKKKRKREREETEEGDHHQSKQRKQEREIMSAPKENNQTPKHHKHVKKHKDKGHEDRKENKDRGHEDRKEIKDRGHEDRKEHKEKARKSTGAPTVKELLGERKMMDAVNTPPPLPSTPNTVWTTHSSNLNDIIESVVRAAHCDPRTVRTPNSCELNHLVFSEDSVSLPTSEDVEMSDDPNHTPPSDSVLTNGHVKDDGFIPTAQSNLTPNLPPTDLKIPETLTDEIRELITRIKQVANQVSNLSSRKTFPSDMNNLLIELEAKCRTISSANKNAVYAHLGTFLPISKDTLIKRARKMSVDKEEEKLEAIITKIKLKIDAVMPAVLLQYSKDCEVATKKATSEKAMDGSGDQKPAENQKPQMPRRLFPWDEQLRSYVREILDIKATCFRILNCRKDTEEDFIKEYLDCKVKPLWPDGWMRTPVLLREGRSTTSMRSRKYTPKPASKKAMPLQHTPVPPPPPLPKPEPKPQLPKHKPPLSSLAAVNSLSYQKPPEPLPPATSSPSLFSQIQSSLTKVPPVQTSSGTNTESVITPSPNLSSTPPVSNTLTSTNPTVKKVSPPKPSPAHSPHSISNLINTTKAHVSSSKYNYPPEAHTPPSGNSSNTFSVKPSGDLLPVSTSLSTLLMQSQSYLPSLAYGLCSLPSKSCSTSTSTSPLYKLPQFPQPLFSPSSSFPLPTPSPTSLSRKSVSPASSPPKKRMSTPSPTLGSDPSNILDLSPASISYSSSKQEDRSVSPLSSTKPPSTPVLHEQSTSPVSSKGGAPGSSMLSLKQRILQDNAKSPASSPSLHAPYLDDSARSTSHMSTNSPHPLRESLAEASVSAASALSQMISDSLLNIPSSLRSEHTPSTLSVGHSRSEHIPVSTSAGLVRSEHTPPSSLNVGYSRSEQTHLSNSVGLVRSQHTPGSMSAGLVRSEQTPGSIGAGLVRSEHPPVSMSAGLLRSEHTPGSMSAGLVRSELTPGSIGAGLVRSEHPPVSMSAGLVRSEHTPGSMSAGLVRSEYTPVSMGAGLVRSEHTPSSISGVLSRSDRTPSRSEFTPSSLSVGLSRSEHTVNSLSAGGMRSEFTSASISGGLTNSAHPTISMSTGKIEHSPSMNASVSRAEITSSVSGGVSRVGHAKPTPLVTGVYQSHPMNTTIGVSLSVPKSTPSSLDLDKPRQRKSSRSSSKDSDGKESEIVADVLKSLMSLNQMSESCSAGSPDKSKGFHESSSGGGRTFSPDVNNKSTSPTSGGSGGAVKIHMGFEDEFKRHIKLSGPTPASTPDFPKDMKIKTFQAEQLMMNSPAASEFSMRMPPVLTPSTPHVTQGNCLMEGFAQHSVSMPPSQSHSNRPTCTTFKPRCHYTDS